MAKGQYEKWRTAEGLTLLAGWARDGLTDAQIAHNMGVSRKTLAEWKKKYGDIGDTLKKGKEIVDLEVESALHRRATGYNAKVNKTFKLKMVDYDPATGRKVKEHEELKTAVDEVHIPADTTAQIFWLRNRMPGKWRDRPDNMAAADSAEATVELAGLMEALGEENEIKQII